MTSHKSDVTPSIPVLSIIMPCYNRSYDLLRVLCAYDAQIGSDPFEVIAVDDASTDTTFQLLSEYRPSHYTLRAVHQTTNRGPAAARNRGIEIAQSPLVAFVGDDIVPAKDFVAQHIAAHERYPQREIAILGHVRWADDLPQNTLMKHIDGIGAQQFSYFYLQDGQEYDYRHFYTANISLKRALLLQSDFQFDTSFPYAAFEDAEFSYRLARLGMRILYQAGIRAEHYHYHTIWSFANRQQRCGEMAWLFIRKHPPVIRDILPNAPHRLVGLLMRRLPVIQRKQTFFGESQFLTLASYYEWLPNHLLDYLYVQGLDYFYYKGMLQSFVAGTWLPEQILAGDRIERLPASIRRFVSLARKASIALPEGFDIQFS